MNLIDPPDFPTSPESLRSILLKPIGRKIPIPFIYSTRNSKIYPHTRFYLYSVDCNTLLLCSAIVRKGEFTHLISMNAFDLIESTDWSIGSFRGSFEEGIFTATSIFPNMTPVSQNSFRLKLDQSKRRGTIYLPIPGNHNCVFSDPPNLNSTLVLDYIEQSVFYNGVECYQLKKNSETEYIVYACSPFSIFQAYCMTLAISSKFK